MRSHFSPLSHPYVPISTTLRYEHFCRIKLAPDYGAIHDVIRVLKKNHFIAELAQMLMTNISSMNMSIHAIRYLSFVPSSVERIFSERELPRIMENLAPA